MKYLIVILGTVVAAKAADLPQFPKLVLAKSLMLSAKPSTHQTTTNLSLNLSTIEKSRDTNHFSTGLQLEMREPPVIWDRMDVTTISLGGGRMTEDRYVFDWIHLPRNWIFGPGVNSTYPNWHSGPERPSDAIILKLWRPNKK